MWNLRTVRDRSENLAWQHLKTAALVNEFQAFLTLASNKIPFSPHPANNAVPSTPTLCSTRASFPFTRRLPFLNPHKIPFPLTISALDYDYLPALTILTGKLETLRVRTRSSLSLWDLTGLSKSPQ